MLYRGVIYVGLPGMYRKLTILIYHGVAQLLDYAYPGRSTNPGLRSWNLLVTFSSQEFDDRSCRKSPYFCWANFQKKQKKFEISASGQGRKLAPEFFRFAPMIPWSCPEVSYHSTLRHLQIEMSVGITLARERCATFHHAGLFIPFLVQKQQFCHF